MYRPPDRRGPRPSRSALRPRSPVARRSPRTTGGTPTSPTCRCTPRSAAWLRHMSPGSDLHPDFGPSYGDGPDYGIPITVVDGDHRKVSGPLHVRRRERPGALPPRPRHPDRGRPAQRRRPARDRRRQATRAGSTRPGRPGCATAAGAPGSGAIWSLRSNTLRPSGWTSADAAGLPILPGLLRWREVRDDTIDHAIRFTTDETSTHHLWPARHDAGLARAPETTRRWARGSGWTPTSTTDRVRPLRAAGDPGDADLRPGPRRQRQPMVLPGRAAPAVAGAA